MDDINNDKVTHLVLPERNNKKARFHLIENKRKHCKHSSVTVDVHNRTIKCSSCSKALDTFDWILKTAERETNIYRHALQVDAETKRRRAALEELKRIEKNYKARIRSTRKKLDDPVIDELEIFIDSLDAMGKQSISADYIKNYIRKIMSLKEGK